MMPIARIVITAFESDGDLHECLKSLGSQTRKDFEVIVVNNSPKEIAGKELWENLDWVTFLNSGENIGFAGGSNFGAKGAQTEWIITLNPDAWPREMWFENLMLAARAEPECKLLSSTLLCADNPKMIDGLGDRYSIFGIGWRVDQGKLLTNAAPQGDKVLFPCGAAATYNRLEFERLGGFDQSFFCYLEDIDLGLRFCMNGHKCLHVLDAEVLHKGGGSQDGDAFKNYHTHKNQLRLMFKLAPLKLLIFQLPLYLCLQIYILLRSINQPNWTEKVKGIAHGMLLLPMALKRVFSKKPKTNTARKYSRMLSWSARELQHKK